MAIFRQLGLLTGDLLDTCQDIGLKTSVSFLHVFVKNNPSCHYLEMIQAQFLIDQHFLVYDIEIRRTSYQETPPPKRQNDFIKDKVDL